MKNGQVIKNADSADLMKEMELVNRYSRRQLSADEVYLFTVALCDNDVDRDYERFTVESLFELEKLFVGKTGIIDHAHRTVRSGGSESERRAAVSRAFVGRQARDGEGSAL